MRDQLGADLFVSRGPLERDSLSLHVLDMPNKAERMAWLAEYVPSLPGAGIVYCLTVRGPVEFRKQVQLGDAFGDEVRRLVFELHIPRLADLGHRKVADIVLRYTTVEGDAGLHEVTIPLTINAVDADTADAADADATVTEQVTILQTAESRRRAQKLAGRAAIRRGTSRAPQRRVLAQGGRPHLLCA